MVKTKNFIIIFIENYVFLQWEIETLRLEILKNLIKQYIYL